MPVGSSLQPTASVPDEMTVTVAGVVFTVTHISNDDGILVSSLSFIADMANVGSAIVCTGFVNSDDATIQVGNGKNHQSYTCTCF